MMQIDPAYGALQVPGVIASYEELDYCRSRLAPKLERRFADRGFVILNYSDFGHLYFFTAQKVENIDELQRRKVCTFSGDQVSKEIWAKAGFKVIDLSLNEILTSLQTGLIEGFVNSPVFALSYQLFAKARYMVDVSYGIAMASTIVAKKDWDRIAPDLQEKLMQAAKNVARDIRVEARSLDRRAIEQMQKYGLEVVRVDPARTASWIDPVQQVYPDIRERIIPSDIFDTTLELRTRFRKENGLQSSRRHTTAVQAE